MKNTKIINNQYDMVKEKPQIDSFSSNNLALDKLSGEKFIQKIFHTSNMSDKEKASLNAKISALTSINLNGFCDFLDITSSNSKNQFTIIRKFIKGNSLNEIIKLKKSDPIFEQILIRIIIIVVSILENLAANQVNLKFITPKDIIISENSSINITKALDYDFIDIDSLSMFDLLYTPPELLKGQNDHSNSLIYSIGTILYELMTAKYTFSYNDRSKLIDSIINELPTLPSLYDFNMDSEIESLILKCLEKNPEKRFSSLSELKNDLIKYYDAKFNTNKFISSFFELGIQATKQKLDFINNVQVTEQKEDDLISFTNFNNPLLIKSFAEEYKKSSFNNFTELEKYLQDKEHSGLIFSEKQLFFVYKSELLSGINLENNIPVFKDAQIGNLEFFEAISVKDFLNLIYFYNILFYKKDSLIEINNISSLEDLNRYVLDNNTGNSLISFKSQDLPDAFLKHKVLYLGNNIVNYLFIKLFVNECIFEKKDNLEALVLDEYDFILVEYSDAYIQGDIFNKLKQVDKDFLVISHKDLYSEAIETFSEQSVFSFDSLNHELLGVIKGKINSIPKNEIINDQADIYAFYKSSRLTNLVVNYNNNLKFLNYENENFNISHVNQVNLIISKIKNVSHLTTKDNQLPDPIKLVKTDEKKSPKGLPVNLVIPESSLQNDAGVYNSEIIPENKELLILSQELEPRQTENLVENTRAELRDILKTNDTDQTIMINVSYHKDNNYILANMLKTDEYTYSESLKTRVLENIDFKFDKNESGSDILQLYNCAKFIVENLFFELISQNKVKNYPLILDLIAKISKIKINSKFKGQYQSELKIPVLIESTDNGLIIIETGNGSEDELLRVSEIIKHLINNLQQNVLAVFYIANSYSNDALDFYDKETKTPKISFFDKLSKIKNIVRLENDRYFHFILLKEENSVISAL